MTTEKRTRSNYTEDFKREAVALVTEQGYTIAEAARSLDVGVVNRLICRRMGGAAHGIRSFRCWLSKGSGGLNPLLGTTPFHRAFIQLACFDG
jgi:hypothetical protein